MASGSSLGPWRAVLTGHLVVNLPALAIILGFVVSGSAVGHTHAGLFVGVAAGWAFWSFSIPRWRRWAIRRGAPAQRLQKIAAATGLVWPKGWVFEKTEARPDDKPSRE